MPLPNNGKSLPYDRTDRRSIDHYAIDLRGSTLHEKTDADEISIPQLFQILPHMRGHPSVIFDTVHVFLHS